MSIDGSWINNFCFQGGVSSNDIFCIADEVNSARARQEVVERAEAGVDMVEPGLDAIVVEVEDGDEGALLPLPCLITILEVVFLFFGRCIVDLIL
jgi:hypothetical protein